MLIMVFGIRRAAAHSIPLAPFAIRGPCQARNQFIVEGPFTFAGITLWMSSCRREGGEGPVTVMFVAVNHTVCGNS